MKLVGNIINLIGLKSLAQQLNDELKDNKNSVTLSPALSFITSFLYEEADILDSDQTMRKTYLGSYATLITTLIFTIDNACTIIIEFENEVPSKSKISSSLASIANGIGRIGQAIARVCLQSKKSRKLLRKNKRTIRINYPICRNEWQCACYLSNV